jgi:hypothetical protein
VPDSARKGQATQHENGPVRFRWNRSRPVDGLPPNQGRVKTLEVGSKARSPGPRLVGRLTRTTLARMRSDPGTGRGSQVLGSFAMRGVQAELPRSGSAQTPTDPDPHSSARTMASLP